MRSPAALVGLALLVGSSCSAGEETPRADGGEGGGTTSTSAPIAAGSAPDVGALIEVSDLPSPSGPGEVEALVVADSEPFDATTVSRFSVCDVDLRAEFGATEGTISRYRLGGIEVAQTVSTGVEDPEGFARRFDELVEAGCEPWSMAADPDDGLGDGDGTLTMALIERVDTTGTENASAGARVRSENQRGASATVVVVLASPTTLSTVTVSGPADADLSVAAEVVEAADARLTLASGPGAGSGTVPQADTD